MRRPGSRFRGDADVIDFAQAGLMSIPPLLQCICCASDVRPPASSVFCPSCWSDL